VSTSDLVTGVYLRPTDRCLPQTYWDGVPTSDLVTGVTYTQTY